MLLIDVLCETFPYPPGSPVPDNILDYRDPDARTKGKYFRYVDSQTGQRRRSWTPQPRTHLVLTKNGGVAVFYYGDPNKVNWPDLLNTLSQEKDPLQGDIFNITVKGAGYLIQRGRETGAWSGDRNRYSTDVIDIVRALYERGVAGASAPIWLGNWAANQGEHIGTVHSILAQSSGQQRAIKLYHGTDTFRLTGIMRNGLRPMTISQRVWNKGGLEKQRPEHREASVYLTASRPQAEYYAKKAVNIDRVRFGPSARRDLSKKLAHAQRQIESMTAQLERFAKMSAEEIAQTNAWQQKYQPYDRLTIADKQRIYPELITKAQETIDQARGLPTDVYNKIEPVILQVTLYRRDFDRLMADDDFLAQNPEIDPSNWEQSLSNFAQIAYKGSIPPERIKVIAQGKDAKQVSR